MMMMMMMMMMIVRECLNSAAARRTLPVQSPHLYSALQTGDYRVFGLHSRSRI